MARPKPPWAWDGFWDNQPVGEFYFNPALSFYRHRMVYYPLHEDLSLSYIRHYSISKIFRLTNLISKKAITVLEEESKHYNLISNENVDKEYPFFRTLQKGTDKLFIHPVVVDNACKNKKMSIKCFFMKFFRRYINFLFLVFGEA